MMDFSDKAGKPPRAALVLACCLYVLCSPGIVTSASLAGQMPSAGRRHHEPAPILKSPGGDPRTEADVSRYYIAVPERLSYTPELADRCRGDVFLVIFVCSAVEHFEHRRMIRQTWGSFQDEQQRTGGAAGGKNRWNCSDEVLQHIRATRLIFHIGLSAAHASAAASVQSEVQKESDRYGDIVQGEFADTYANLSLKSVSMLRWMTTYCPGARYLMKTDDDMFINIPLLLRDLANVVHKKFLMGDIISAARPIRDKASKWYTPVAAYNRTTYPRYISGAAYVISGDLMADLHAAATTGASGRDRMFWIEDVYVTGVLAERVNGTLIFNGKFRYTRPYFHPCFLRLVIAAHRLDPVTLETMWGAVHDPSLGCDYPVLKV